MGYPSIATSTSGDSGSVARASLPITNLTIAAGGTAQQILAADPNIKYLAIDNYGVADIWLNTGAAAAEDVGTFIASGVYHEFLVAPTDSISVFCQVTGHKFAYQKG